jgi:hypothetical protein
MNGNGYDNAVNLGDRDLAIFVSNDAYTYATYSYSDLNGNGVAN